MAEHLWERGTLTLPGNFGRLYIQGFKKQPLMTKDRKMIYEQYVDWGSSLKMWQTDEEARQEGLLVRYNPGITYKIGFNLRTDRSNRTLVPNLSFFKFHSQTSLRKLGAEIIRAGEPPPIERSSMFRNKRGSVLAPRNYKEVKEMDKRRNNPWADFVY
ncbi:MAG: hypothetical protein LBE56_12695 [Tannerella sp.]|nr:hypothetical protein [Tannerella sp.]